MEREETEQFEITGPFDTSIHPPLSQPKGGFWQRGAAYIVDLVLLQGIYTLFLKVGLTAIDLALAHTARFTPDGMLLGSGPFQGLWVFLFILYFTFFSFWGGQTPGKILLHLRVVTQNYEDLTLFRALIRSLCYFLSILFLVGFLIAGLNREKRALHDFIVRTYVVKT